MGLSPRLVRPNYGLVIAPSIPTAPAHPDGADVVIRDVSRRFESPAGPIDACVDISLEMTAGEFLAIVGPSGCGKSTLLRMVAGLDTPTSGTISTTAAGGRTAQNAMVFHGRTLFPWRTLRQNVAYGLGINGMSRAERSQRADELLSLVGLTRFADAWPHQVSEGMRQRTSLARALAVEPELLLMDEPFGALDEQTRFIMQEELLRIWEQTGKSVIFVTHSIDEALLLADRIMIMTAQPGQVREIIDVPFARPRSLSDVRNDPRFAELFDHIWSMLRTEVEAGGAFAP